MSSFSLYIFSFFSISIIPPLYSFCLCVSLYTMFSNITSTRAPSTKTRLFPRLSTLFHFGSLSWQRNPPPPPTLSYPSLSVFHSPFLSTISPALLPCLYTPFAVPSPLRVCGRRLGRLPVSLRDFCEPLS